VKLPKGEARELPAVQTVITQADGSIEVTVGTTAGSQTRRSAT
jgi:hypothetical protein